MTATHRMAVSLASATAIANGVGWVVLVLLAGAVVPRATLVTAALAVALAHAAYRAAQAREFWVLLLAASLGMLTPPELGDAPAAFRYLGVLSFGYAISALLLVGASRRPAAS